MRLWTIRSSGDTIVCNDEKLASGGTASYLHAAESFLRHYIFAPGKQWPDVILAPAFLAINRGASNFAVKVTAVIRLGRESYAPLPYRIINTLYRRKLFPVLWITGSHELRCKT